LFVFVVNNVQKLIRQHQTSTWIIPGVAGTCSSKSGGKSCIIGTL